MTRSRESLTCSPWKMVAAARTAAAMSLAISASVLSGCNRGNAPGAPAAAGATMPPAFVTTKVAVARDVPFYIDEIGRAAAVESVSLQPQVSGRVTEVHFREGTDVKKGDKLFTIDPRPFKAALDAALATLAQNRETLHLAQIEFDRVEGLQASNAISQTEYDQKKSAVAIGEATVKAGEAAVETAKLNLEYCTIVAPMDGRTGLVLVDPGNNVKMNENTLVMIQKVDPIDIDFTITERELPNVRRYMSNGELKVLVASPGQQQQQMQAIAVGGGMPTTNPAGAVSTSQPGAADMPPQIATAPAPTMDGSREGTLAFLDNTVEGVSGTIKLRASLKNDDRRYWPGQFVNVRLVLETKKDAVLVPTNSIQIGQQGTFVYVVKPDSTAELRPVKEGQRQGSEVVIDSGVAAGEQVVVTGQMMVMPGGKVVVTPGADQQPPRGGGGGAPAAGASASAQ